MKFSWNLITQVLGTIVQGANAVGGILPPDIKVTVALGVGVIQAIVALIAHFSNPDGTSAKSMYIPPAE